MVYEGHQMDFGKAEPTFWQQKTYCDGLGGGFQMPTPTNEVENQVAHELVKVAYMADSTFIGIAQQLEKNGEIFEDW